MSDAASSVRALSCPQCGGTIALRAAGTTVTLVCEHCGTPLDATSPELRAIGPALAAMRTPEIPLGTRGTLDGNAWEAIGYQERSDGEIAWCEYLLFNPYEGYAFLIDDGRRFSLGRLMTRMPGSNGTRIADEGRDFKRFGDTYPVRTTFVVGEFYWRVAIGERVEETDYVRPGTMLSCEENASERTWTRTELLGHGVAEKAFGIPRRSKGWTGTQGPAPHEPSPYADLLREAWVIAAAAVLVLLFLAAVGSPTHRLAVGNIAAPLDGTSRTAVIGPFDLPDARAAVSIAAEAEGLDNMWVDLDYSLVDARTQASFDGYATAERYHGRDSDGNWSEGDASPRVRLASIPRGTYRLVVEVAAHRWIDPKASTPAIVPEPALDGGTIPIAVTIDRGGSFGGNVILALILIALWPLLLLFLHSGFEKRRMAPVTGGGDDEDDD